MVDGALLAHMGMADMRVPIAYALHHPRRALVTMPPVDLASGLSLDFVAPDEQTFPAVALAREAGARGDVCACALNAANEVAVRSFLAGVLPFLGITAVVEEIIAQSDEGSFGTYEDVVAVDTWARRRASEACARRSG